MQIEARPTPREGTCALDQWNLKNLTAIPASDSKYIMMNPSRFS